MMLVICAHCRQMYAANVANVANVLEARASETDT